MNIITIYRSKNYLNCSSGSSTYSETEVTTALKLRSFKDCIFYLCIYPGLTFRYITDITPRLGDANRLTLQEKYLILPPDILLKL